MLWDRFTNYFVNDIGIDLGTMNTLVWNASRDEIVLEEPSYVAVNVSTGKVRAVGREAKRMQGRTPGLINVIRPMRDGVIADAAVTDEMLRIYIRKAAGFKFMMPRVLIAVPSGITDVEARAVRDSAHHAGVREVRLVEEPFASALGVGLPVTEPDASMIVDIGGGTTEVAVISLGAIVSCNSEKCGGDAMDAAIIAHMQKKHNLQIAEPTAEVVKIQIGSACPLQEELTMEVSGYDLAGNANERRPRAVTITSEEIREALSDPLSRILLTVKKTISNCGPELAARLLKNGITLAGGGSLLRGLDTFISTQSELRTVIGNDPLHAVVNGTGALLRDSAAEIFGQPENMLIGHGSINYGSIN